jgi:hypothetical protein
MFTPKNKILMNRDPQVKKVPRNEMNPSELSLSIIRQFARNNDIDKRLNLPDNILSKN